MIIQIDPIRSFSPSLWHDLFNIDHVVLEIVEMSDKPRNDKEFQQYLKNAKD